MLSLSANTCFKKTFVNKKEIKKRPVGKYFYSYMEFVWAFDSERRISSEKSILSREKEDWVHDYLTCIPK